MFKGSCISWQERCIGKFNNKKYDLPKIIQMSDDELMNFFSNHDMFLSFFLYYREYSGDDKFYYRRCPTCGNGCEKVDGFEKPSFFLNLIFFNIFISL